MWRGGIHKEIAGRSVRLRRACPMGEGVGGSNPQERRERRPLPPVSCARAEIGWGGLNLTSVFWSFGSEKVL